MAQTYHVSTGMSSFLSEYVITQNIPIVKLLFAFGISLVTHLMLSRKELVNLKYSAQSCGTSDLKQWYIFCGSQCLNSRLNQAGFPEHSLTLTRHQ